MINVTPMENRNYAFYFIIYCKKLMKKKHWLESEYYIESEPVQLSGSNKWENKDVLIDCRL